MRKAASGSAQQINRAAGPGACVAAGKQFLAAALPDFSRFRAGLEALEPPWAGVHGWTEVPGGAALLHGCGTTEPGKQSPCVNFGPDGGEKETTPKKKTSTEVLFLVFRKDFYLFPLFFSPPPGL